MVTAMRSRACRINARRSCMSSVGMPDAAAGSVMSDVLSGGGLRRGMRKRVLSKSARQRVRGGRQHSKKRAAGDFSAILLYFLADALLYLKCAL